MNEVVGVNIECGRGEEEIEGEENVGEFGVERGGDNDENGRDWEM